MTSTPSPASTHTPPTPLHGPLFDSPPHLSLRKSSRLSKQSERTPSPAAANSFNSEGPGELKRTPKSSRSRIQLSPPSSPLDPDDMVTTTRGMLKKQAKEQGLPSQASSTLLTLGLPTPVKTPRKKALSTHSGAAGRILFPGQQRENVAEQLMTPSKRNKRIKKHVGFSLDEDMENGNGQIEIYTDNKERVPELDERADNPFYVKDQKAQRTSNKRKRVTAEDMELDNGVRAMEKDRGMYYVFRGRRVFKRFDGANPVSIRGPRGGSESPLHAYNTSADQQMGDDADAAEDDTTAHTHFTRSSIKPRRLFNPESEESRHHLGTTTDEEAMTDIEDPESHGIEIDSHAAKGKSLPRKAAIIEDATRSFDAPPSPFDNWPRRKPTRDVSGIKREGELLQGASAAKRSREAR